jgi:hypothetical protein
MECEEELDEIGLSILGSATQIRSWGLHCSVVFALWEVDHDKLFRVQAGGNSGRSGLL